MLAQALYSLGCLVLVTSLEHGHYQHHGQSELQVEVNAKAKINLQASRETGLLLAGSSALRQLGLRARPGCKHSANLVHRLRRSRANFTANKMPLNYMHIDHTVYQVGLTVFDLWNDRNEVLEVLDEDASSPLQPFLQDVSRWREVCSPSIAETDKSASGKALLVLSREQQDSDGSESSWDDMATEFAIYIARKALRKRPEEIHVWKRKDGVSLAELLSKDQACFRSVAVLSGEPWSFAWAQHFRCNVPEGRLVLRFVEHVMQRHPVQHKNASDDSTAQVCLSSGNAQLLKPLELCELQGREVQIKVAPTAADVAQCDAFLALPGTTMSGAELWLRESSSFVEILPKNKAPTTLIENLALLTGAKRFTLGSHLPQSTQDDNQVEMAERAILALNRAGADAADGALDDGIAGVGQLEGCEEFYHPRDGWIEGWRDVARSLKLAKKGERLSGKLDESKHLPEATEESDSEGDPGHGTTSEDSPEAEEKDSTDSDAVEDEDA